MAEKTAMDTVGPGLEVEREAARGDGLETRVEFSDGDLDGDGGQFLGVVAVARRRECWAA
jgi:hypothetical protein